MKKIFLSAFFCFCVHFLTFGSFANDSILLNDSIKLNDTSKKEVGEPVLTVRGTSVYKENKLLQKNQVLSILSTTPAIAKQYATGKSLRGAGTGLILGGSALFVIGVGVMVDAIITESATSVETYNSSTYSTTTFDEAYFGGFVVAIIGELIVDGGIACSIVGKVKIRRAINNYNRSVTSFNNKYTPGGALKYQLGLLDSGKFGLKLTF